jgi:cobalt/nickel transport system permease protein
MLRIVDASAHANRWRTKTPAVALLCAGLMLCALLTPNALGAALVVVLCSTATTLGAGVPSRGFFAAFLIPLMFLLTSAASLCVSVGWGTGGLHVALSQTGATTALRTAWHAVAALSVSLLFAFTVPLANLISLLRALRAPEAVLDLVLLTYRSIFLLDDCRVEIIRAQQNRLGYRTSSVARRSAAMAASALFARALDRAVKQEKGLAARGYNGRLDVLALPSTVRASDFLSAILAPTLIALVTYAWELKR